MNRRIILALFAACATATAARPSAPAAAAAPEPTPLASLPEIKAEPYQLQNRSSFTLPSNTRTPMWPIGWVRPVGYQPVDNTIKPVAGAGFLIQPHHLTVNSILLLSGEPLATINGKAFGEGEVLPVYIGEKPVKVTVKAIRDGVVILEQNGRQIICPIQRKTVPERTSDPSQPAEVFKIKIQDR